MKFKLETNSLKKIYKNLKTFKNIIIKKSLKHISFNHTKKRQQENSNKVIYNDDFNNLLLNKIKKNKLKNNYKRIQASINRLALLLLNLILFNLINPILTKKPSNNNRKLSYNLSINLTIVGGNKVKIINQKYIPDRVFINGNESTIDRYGRITTKVEEIYFVTLEWNEKKTNYDNLFQDTDKVIEIYLSNFDTTGVISMNSMFFNCVACSIINFTNFNTSMVISMNSMFENCYNLESLDLTNFDTRKVESMNYMFKGCSLLKFLNISNFYTPVLREMNEMFRDCSNLKYLDISNMNTSLITDMNMLFSGCGSLTSLDISNLNTTNVEDMSQMFRLCSSLISLDLSNMDSSKVINMNGMFSMCFSLVSINLSNFNTLKVINMESLFFFCNSLKSIDLSSFSTSNVEKMRYMFSDCSSLISLDLSHFDFYKKEIHGLFRNCKSLKTIKFPKNNNRFYGYINSTFEGCSSLLSLDIPNLDLSLVESMDSLFSDCSSLTILDLSNQDVTSVKSMKSIFNNCTALTSINLTNFKTSSLLDMNSMFKNCISLTSLDLRSFNTQSVYNMSNLFYNCKNIISLNLSNFNTSLVSTMNSMFGKCSSLEILDISSFNISSVGNMEGMFENCIKLTSLDLSNFNSKMIINMDSMFSGCKQLKFINFYNYNESSINILNDIFYDTPKDLIICINKGTDLSLLTDHFTFEKCFITDCKFEEYIKRKKIYDSKECIHNCIDDDINKYEYNGFCYRVCPNGTHSDKNDTFSCKVNVFECIEEYPFLIIDDNKCSNTCNSKNFFDNICKINNYNINSESIMIGNIISGIQEGFLDELLIKLINGEKEDIIKKEGNILYQITSSFNQNNKNYIDISTVKLGLCENILKEAYNIAQNETLIIFKTEITSKELLIPLIEYEIFSPITKEILNLDYCKDKNIYIDIIIPVSINENKIFIYEPNSPFYKDICYAYKTENNTDFTLYDRKNEFNINNLSTCPYDCLYERYDNKKKISYCHCKIQKRSNLFSDITQKELIYKFSNSQRATNLDILKCFKQIISKDTFAKNYVNYIFILIIFFYIFSAIYIYKRGYNLICEQINQILEAKNVKLKDMKYELNFGFLKRNSNRASSSNRNNKVNKKNNFSKSDMDLKISSNNNIISINKEEEEKKAENVMKYTDYEINTLSYQEALEKDKRTFFQYYISLLKTYHILIFSFNPDIDYNSYLIKICLFLFYLILILVINTLFFNDSTMHQIYLDKGTFNLKYIFPKIIYSLIISFLIYICIRVIALTQKEIIDIKHEKNRNNLNAKVLIAIKCIIIKIIVFFICSIILLLIFWYYISCFCAIYRNTQIYLVKSVLITYLVLFIYPFFLCLISGVFRIPSLKKSGEYFYKITQIIQLL